MLISIYIKNVVELFGKIIKYRYNYIVNIT